MKNRYERTFDRYWEKQAVSKKDEARESFHAIWKPLLYTKGQLDIKKISKEMRDLIFVYTQVAEVYRYITGGLLSKPMYYAGTIISEYEYQLSKSYEEGYDEGKKDGRKRKK